MRACVLVIYKRGIMDGAATAVEQAFEGKPVDAVLIDERELGVKSGVRGYIYAVRHCPSLSGGYLNRYYKKYRIGKYKEISDEGGKFAIIDGVKQSMHKSENVLYRFHPAVVICLTSKSLALMIAAKRNTGCGAIICSGLYDFTRHAGLTDKACDKYMVATHSVAASLMRSGVKDGDIYVTGFPVSADTAVRESARAKLGIDDGLPAVAVIGGRYGNKAIVEATKWLSAYQGKLHTVVVTSGNREAEKAAESMSDSGVIALSGDTNMSEVYAACDIALISPTPFTVAECARSNIPVVLLAPCNRKEKAAFKFLTRGGYCLAGDTQLSAMGAVQDLIMDDALYMKRASAIGEVCSKGMYDGIGKAVESMLALMDGKDAFEGRDADNEAKDSASGDDSEDIAVEQEGADDVQGNAPGDEGRAERAVDGDSIDATAACSERSAADTEAKGEDKPSAQGKDKKGFGFFRKK